MMGCVCIHSGLMLGTVLVLCLGPQRKVFVCVVMLFYSQTESLHNTAEMVWMRVGLIGTKKGDRKSVV